MRTNINERIRYVRKQANLNQQEFADKLGLNRGTVSNYEIGSAVPMDAIIMLIARTFKVSEAWLRTGEGEPNFVPGEEEADLAEWVATVCVDRDMAFQRRFLNVIKNFSDQEWYALELLAKKAKEIVGEE